MREIIANPYLITKKAVKALHYVYRGPMRHNNTIESNGIIIIYEKVRGESSIVQLTIIPRGLWNVIFITSAPISAPHAHSIISAFDTVPLAPSV